MRLECSVRIKMQRIEPPPSEVSRVAVTFGYFSWLALRELFSLAWFSAYRAHEPETRPLFVGYAGQYQHFLCLHSVAPRGTSMHKFAQTCTSWHQPALTCITSHSFALAFLVMHRQSPVHHSEYEGLYAQSCTVPHDPAQRCTSLHKP